MKSKDYLEIDYFLIVKNHKIELCEILYDFEFENLQEALEKINLEIKSNVELTAFFEESTINTALQEFSIMEDFKSGYGIVIKNPEEAIKDLLGAE